MTGGVVDQNKRKTNVDYDNFFHNKIRLDLVNAGCSLKKHLVSSIFVLLHSFVGLSELGYF